MNWTDIVRNVVVRTGVGVDVDRLIALIERASTDMDEAEDSHGIYDVDLQRAPFLAALERELQTQHTAWDPAFLAQARAVVYRLPRLLDRIVTFDKGSSLRRNVIHDVLEQIERDAQTIEQPRAGVRHCPRCGSHRLDSQKTTALGTNLYERLCLACGYHEMWEEGIAPWAASSSDTSKD